MNNPLQDQSDYERLVMSIAIAQQLSYAEAEQRIKAAIRGNALDWRSKVEELLNGVNHSVERAEI